MRFAFIDKQKDRLSIDRLCQIMDINPRGYRVYRSRPLSDSQRKDMVLVAHSSACHWAATVALV